MKPAPRALTASQAALAKQVQGSLARGEAQVALAQARNLAQAAPLAPDAHQALGVAAAQAGELGLAEQSFLRALRLVPGQASLLCNLALARKRLGKRREGLADLRQAATAQPQSTRVWRQRAELALELDELDEARLSWQRCLALQPGDALAWQSLAYTLRLDGDTEGAEQALLHAIELDPRQPEPWLGLGVSRRLQGRPDEALRCFARAAELGLRDPELLLASCGAWADCGDTARALALTEQLVAQHPGFASGQAALADLYWEHPNPTRPDPLAALIDAARRQSGNLPLWHACAAKLLRAGRTDEALALMSQASSPDPLLRQLQADAWQQTGQGERAEAVYAALLREAGDETPNALLTSAAALMLARGRHAEAEDLAGRATRRRGRDQLAWAYLGTAWRLRGDARADWLWDVERLVTQRPVDEAGLSALRAALEPLHQALRAPLAQTLRRGSQTPGMLFGRPDPALQRLAGALRRSVEAWLPGLLHDPAHPVLSRLDTSVRYVGAWSVRLRSAGHHVHHIHGEGWFSSAYHVSLPATVRDGSGSDAGCLVLGLPPVELGLTLPPLRVVRPREGHLVLFPSCLWHGTVPFEDDEDRLSVAFDVQPCAAAVAATAAPQTGS